MELDHRYTWVLPRKAWYIRFYIWLWEANPEDISFCKLWWGYVFALPFLVTLKPVLGLSAFIGKLLGAAKQARQERRPQETPKTPAYQLLGIRLTAGRNIPGSRLTFKLRERDPALRPSYLAVHFGDGTRWLTNDKEFCHVYHEVGTYRLRIRVERPGAEPGPWLKERNVGIRLPIEERPIPQKVLEGLSYTGGKAVWAIQGAAYTVKQVTRPVTRPVQDFVRPVLPASEDVDRGIRVLGQILNSALVNAVRTVVTIFLFGVLVIGLCVAVVHADTWTAEVTHPYVWVPLVVAAVTVLLLWTGMYMALVKVFVKPAIEGTKRGSLTFRDMMRIGYKSVKENTCPRVVIEETKGNRIVR